MKSSWFAVVFFVAAIGASVTFQLSPNLTLCAGTGSITEGTFLSTAGSTLFNVIDHGGGLYTADNVAIATCGPTALNGLLFTVEVASTAAGGTGTLTVTSVVLRDCSNADLPVAAGAAGSVAIDNQAPVVAVTSPNGGEALGGGSNFPVTWTATDNVGVATVDIDYSTDSGATYPNSIAVGVPNTGSYVWAVPAGPTAHLRVRVTAHDTGCAVAADASDADFTIGNLLAVGGAPSLTELSPVIPNPVRGRTTLQYALAARGPVSLAIYSVDGRRVRTLAQGVRDAGRYDVAWNGTDDRGATVTSGVFFVRLEAAGLRRTRLITLVR